MEHYRSHYSFSLCGPAVQSWFATITRFWSPVVNPACPACQSDSTYPDREFLVCAECGFEFTQSAQAPVAAEADGLVRDAYGQVLNDGDAVLLVKELKVKGSSITLKVGTKIKNIRLKEGDHDVDCKVDGVGVMLKSMYLKKAT